MNIETKSICDTFYIENLALCDLVIFRVVNIKGSESYDVLVSHNEVFFKTRKILSCDPLFDTGIKEAEENAAAYYRVKRCPISSALGFIVES